jgi:cytochrome b
MLLLVLGQAVTGLFTSDDVLTDGPLVPLVDTHTVHLMSDIHRSLYILLLVVIGLHVAAIAFYKLIRKDDLVRPMITGGKVLHPDAGAAPPHASLWLAALLLALSAAAVWGGLSLVPG